MNLQDYNAAAVGAAMNAVFKALETPSIASMPEPSKRTPMPSIALDYEALLTQEARERSILEVSVVEALMWLRMGAGGRASETLSRAMEALEAQRSNGGRP